MTCWRRSSRKRSRDRFPETPERTLHSQAAERVLKWAEEMDVLALGPGVSRHPETAQLIRRLVAQSPQPFVLDADGLNACAEEPSSLEGQHAPPSSLPTPGRWAGFMGLSTEEVQARRFEVAHAAAKRFHAVVVLKGQYTIIADGDRTMINPTGNPGLASGGTGDVLTGLIGSLLGQRLTPFQAAVAGTYLHGLAGDLAAAAVGRPSLLASDVVEALPGAFAQVLDA